MEPLFLNQKTAAAAVGLSVRQMQRLRPPSYKVGRNRLYKIEDLKAWVEKHFEQAGSPVPSRGSVAIERTARRIQPYSSTSSTGVGGLIGTLAAELRRTYSSGR